jgi:ATP-dependent Lon protease
MRKKDEPTLIIPLFALPMNIFPGEALPLHIFEERYRELVAYCLEGPKLGKLRPFGISLASDDHLADIGCAVMIERVVTRYDDGKLDIITHGGERYRTRRVIREKIYPEIEIEFFGDASDESSVETADVAITLFMKVIEMAKGHPPKGNLTRSSRLSFELAHGSGLEPGERQILLEMTSEEERLQHLIKYYRALIPVLSWKEDVQGRIRANGHFRKIPGAKV